MVLRVPEENVGSKEKGIRTDRTTVVLKIGAPKQPEIAIAVEGLVPVLPSS